MTPLHVHAVLVWPLAAVTLSSRARGTPLRLQHADNAISGTSLSARRLAVKIGTRVRTIKLTIWGCQLRSP
jgi:hypothetical protein